MGQPFGRNTPLPNTGVPIFALADTITYVPVAGGITIDWATVAAVGTDTVTSTPEGITVKAGQKFLRYGQVLTKITASGKWGPYDPGAADGRQTLARGNVCVLNETLLENGILGFTNRRPITRWSSWAAWPSRPACWPRPAPRPWPPGPPSPPWSRCCRNCGTPSSDPLPMHSAGRRPALVGAVPRARPDIPSTARTLNSCPHPDLTS
jgi:hypothetical protein